LLGDVLQASHRISKARQLSPSSSSCCGPRASNANPVQPISSLRRSTPRLTSPRG